jgi:hypothetical protein
LKATIPWIMDLQLDGIAQDTSDLAANLDSLAGNVKPQDGRVFPGVYSLVLRLPVDGTDCNGPVLDDNFILPGDG